MTLAEKLTVVAENVPKVYEAGYKAGQVTPEEKEVNFFDYDGTLLYSYTLDEVQSLTELPSGPNWHDGLVFDGWNWSLDGVNTLTRPMTIGAMYTTDDGATRLHISIPDFMQLPLALPLYFQQTVSHGVLIDWGDGSETETVNGTNVVNISHAYTISGDYVIKLFPFNNCILNLGANDGANTILGPNQSERVPIYAILKKVEIGKSTERITSRCFQGYKGLSSCTIPKSVTTINGYAFYGCGNMSFLTVPLGCESLGIYSFYEAYQLHVISLSERLKNGAEGVFMYAYALKRIDYPDAFNLTGSIGYDAHRECKALQEINIKNGINPHGATIRGCASLSKIRIHSGSSEITNRFAYGCISLFEIEIPENVTLVGAEAFANCTGVKRVKFLSKTPPTLSADASTNIFAGVPADCVYYVPIGTLEAYQTATNLASIADQMQEDST